VWSGRVAKPGYGDRVSFLHTLDAGARAFLVVAGALDAPAVSAAAAAVTAEQSSEETVSGVTPATLNSPGGEGDPAAIMLLNGATEQGRHHPRVIALAQALARAGYLVLVPDISGIGRGEVTAEGVRSAVECSLELSSRARRGRVAVFGVSVGTTLALLAAAEDALARRVTVVAGISGYTDLTELVRLATTGTYVVRGEIKRYPAESFLSLCVARSACSGLEPGRGREVIGAALDAVPADDPDPLARLRSLGPVGFDDESRAMLTLLVNRDPARFDEHYAALSEALRAKIDRLSPIRWVERLQAPVELLVDPRDKYFPPEHARALERASPRVRVTLTHALAHADMRLSFRGAADAMQLIAFATRALETVRFH
jgi:pimeloyl-ACP methyl ester carboxylesterase